MRNTEKTISVPEAGRRYFGLGREGSYAAARRGDIPTIRLGPKLLRVPVAAMERLVNATEPYSDGITRPPTAAV